MQIENAMRDSPWNMAFPKNAVSEVNNAVEKVFSGREGDALLLIARELFYSDPKTLYDLIPIFPAIREVIWKVMFQEDGAAKTSLEQLQGAFSRDEMAVSRIHPALEVTGCFSR